MAYEKQFWEHEYTENDSEVDRLEKRLVRSEAKVNLLTGWLWQYREELKSTNVFHKNQGLINAIDKLLK